MSEETKQEEQAQTIEVTPEVAFSLKLQEFDKLISNAKVTVSNLEAQKYNFIYNENVK